MRFTCEQTILSDALGSCIHAVSAKSTITALEGILLNADESVTLSAYNFKTAICKTFFASVYKTGKYVLNARMFYDIVKKLPDDMVEVSIEQNMTATIKCGASEYNIMATAAEEFPALPEVSKNSGIAIQNKMLKTMINDTIFAISDNENKPIHTGSLFEIEGTNLNLVSVDGYRLALRREEVANQSGESFSFVVPGDTLRDVMRLLPENEELTHIFPDKKHALFEIADTLVTTRLLEGEFLDYRRAIPENLPYVMQVDVKKLQTSVERVSLIISERLKNPIRCVFFDSSVKLSCTTTLGRATDECEIGFCPETIEIGFNNKYMIDALRACPDAVVNVGLSDGISPCVLRPVEGEHFVYLILPVRLKQ